LPQPGRAADFASIGEAHPVGDAAQRRARADVVDELLGGGDAAVRGGELAPQVRGGLGRGVLAAVADEDHAMRVLDTHDQRFDFRIRGGDRGNRRQRQQCGEYEQ
jgi:hypothetical protein